MLVRVPITHYKEVSLGQKVDLPVFIRIHPCALLKAICYVIVE